MEKFTYEIIGTAMIKSLSLVSCVFQKVPNKGDVRKSGKWSLRSMRNNILSVGIKIKYWDFLYALSYTCLTIAGHFLLRREYCFTYLMCSFADNTECNLCVFISY